MKEYLTKTRIWYLAAFLVQLACGFLIFAPHFSYVEDGEILRLSVTTFYEALDLSSIYTVTMIVYFFMTAPLLFGGLMHNLKRWPLVFSLVVVSLFTLLNVLWFTLVILAGRQITDTFSPMIWFYVYLLVQLGIIANLIIMIVKIKPVKEIKKRKKW